MVTNGQKKTKAAVRTDRVQLWQLEKLFSIKDRGQTDRATALTFDVYL